MTRSEPTGAMRRTKAKAVLAAVSLLVAGGVLGAALDRHLAPARRHAPAELHAAAIASLAERLQLDSAQQRQVDSIIGAHHGTLQETWAALHAHIGAAVDSVHRDLEAMLTPEQRAEFRAWLGEMSGAARH